MISNTFCEHAQTKLVLTRCNCCKLCTQHKQTNHEIAALDGMLECFLFAKVITVTAYFSVVNSVEQQH